MIAVNSDATVTCPPAFWGTVEIVMAGTVDNAEKLFKIVAGADFE